MGGTEWIRLTMMCLTHLLFLFETSVMGVISVAKDRDALRHPAELAKSAAQLPKSPFLSMRAARMLAQYNQRGFHPNDRDNTQLVAQWREKLFGREGRLTELLQLS
jgi:predicted metal-dependent hydrolase